MDIPKSNNHKKIRLLAISGIVLAIFFIAYTYRFVIYRQLNNLKLIPTSEHFTELYFENSTTLPKKIPDGRIVYFSFTIHNLEGKNVDYHYSVYLQDELGHIVTIDNRTQSLKDNESKTILESYRFDSVNHPKETIFVSLPELNQDIHFSLINAQ
jgi:hypothetical protein